MLYGAASVEAKSLSVGSLLEERYPFAVPRYQRAYSWDDEAVGDFIRDVESMLSKPAGETSHFFGGVVCIELNNNQKVRPLSYEVVDGQQRLATFTMALSCVVEVAQEIEKSAGGADESVAGRALTLRTDTIEKYLSWKEADVAAGVTKVQPRLTLSLADEPVFHALISIGSSTPPPTRESHKLLIDAKLAILDMTRRTAGNDAPAGERIDRLLRLRQALVQDAHLIHIVSKERSQAYRLFSVLNHRGESLSDADLLRSRSLEMLESFPTAHEDVAKLWDEILATPAKNVENFFRALFPSWTGERVRGDLFEATEKKFFPNETPKTAHQAQAVVDVISHFRDELDIYLKLANGIWPYDRPPGAPNSVRAWQIDRLRRLIITLKHELAMPVLLAGAQCLPESVFADMVYTLEIFAFRYKIICNGHASRPANEYYKQAAEIRTSKDANSYNFAIFRSNLRKLIDSYANDSLFRQLIVENLRYNNPSQRSNIRELLTTLEDHQQWWLKTGSTQPNAKPKPSMTKIIDITEASLEHIYPQNADDEDKDHELEPLKNSIGNLTFFGIDDNVAAANKPFSAKRTENYANSCVSMTAALAEKESWATADIKAREEDLLIKAVRIFKI